MEALLTEERKHYHRMLLDGGVLTVDKNGVPSNADSSSRLSKEIAKGIADQLMAEVHEKALGQTSGAKFEQINMEFLAVTFPKLQNVRPGKWHIVKLGNRNAIKTSSFCQYEHLDYLAQLLAVDSKLAASMGNDYMVAPDVVVYREPLTDEELNSQVVIVDDSVALQTDIRAKNGGLPILHASISAKWTMRSDRAQNSRTARIRKLAPIPASTVIIVLKLCLTTTISRSKSNRGKCRLMIKPNNPEHKIASKVSVSSRTTVSKEK